MFKARLRLPMPHGRAIKDVGVGIFRANCANSWHWLKHGSNIHAENLFKTSFFLCDETPIKPNFAQVLWCIFSLGGGMGWGWWHAPMNLFYFFSDLPRQVS